MKKKLSGTNSILLIAVALTVLAFTPLSSQAFTVTPGDGDLGALGNGDSAHFSVTGQTAGSFFQTFEFDYVGTGAIYIAAAAPRLPEEPPFIFGIDNFRFEVGPEGEAGIWDSISFSEEVIGLILTPQELADADIEFGDRLAIVIFGDAIGSFPSSYAGDVGVVPIPAAAWLLGGGLIGLLGLRSRFKN